MTVATIGNWQIETSNGASPEVLTAIEEVLDVSEFGLTNELLEVTNFDSPTGTKEFIAGLAEGDEFTVEANFSTTFTHQQFLRGDKGNSRSFRLRYTGTSPEKTWTGTAVNQGWKMLPSVTEQNKIQFTMKISGDITEA